MSDELKPCPFCGDHETALRQNPQNQYFIICYGCEMTTNYYQESEWLLWRWNTRPEEVKVE